MRKLFLLLAVLLILLTACEPPWIDLPPKLPPVPEPVIAVPAEEPPEESIATLIPATVEPTAERSAPASDTSYPFPREMRDDSAVFYGKQGVVMEITPAIFQIPLGMPLGYWDILDKLPPEKAYDPKYWVKIWDPYVKNGDPVMIYDCQGYRINSFGGIVSLKHVGIAYGDDVVRYVYFVGPFSRRPPSEGPIKARVTIGYTRGGELHDSIINDPNYMERMREVCATHFGLGDPIPEALVEGYVELEFYEADFEGQVTYEVFTQLEDEETDQPRVYIMILKYIGGNLVAGGGAMYPVDWSPPFEIELSDEEIYIYDDPEWQDKYQR